MEYIIHASAQTNPVQLFRIKQKIKASTRLSSMVQLHNVGHDQVAIANRIRHLNADFITDILANQYTSVADLTAPVMTWNADPLTMGLHNNKILIGYDVIISKLDEINAEG